ncbi:DNA cytosine methyltransferase, partial [Candidatus Marinimicrobia bacterium]|nr:DNA cytosine methyltransferase [Candidatus Neomarinimicrobiota bacterium]
MKKYSYVSLFSSAGVGCFGFKLEGFDCVATNELIERRLQVQKNNKTCFKSTGYLGGDVKLQETKDKILNEVNLYKENNEDIDFLTATPPCQGISLANHKKTKSDKHRNSLVLESILLTKAILPRVFIFENVRNFMKTICTDEDGEDKRIDETIFAHLSDEYIICSYLLNFKNFGVSSSRTRALVIGVRKDIVNIHPLKLLPFRSDVSTLRDTIGHLNSLSEMGEFDEDDFLHNYKSFDLKMLPWVELLKEGESAFDNTDPNRIPHSIKDDVVVPNANKNGDKYKRQLWENVAPCVHTRNDTFSSQNTIHPKDNRVFSIRELMLMMSVPDSFQWFKEPYSELNKLESEKKKRLLKTNEINIRQSLGEAVPTNIFKQIASNYKRVLNNEYSSNLSVKELDEMYELFKYFIPDGPKTKSIRIKVQSKNQEFIAMLIEHLNILNYYQVKLKISGFEHKNLDFTLPAHINVIENIERFDFMIYDNLSQLDIEPNNSIKKHILISKNAEAISPTLTIKDSLSMDKVN